MIIGYGKLNSRPDPATVDRLRQELIEAGAETVFVDVAPLWAQASDQATSTISRLEAALQAIRPGDVLLTLTPTHLTDSVASLIDIANRLTASGAALRVLRLTGGQTLDTGTPAGAVLLTALGLLAAFDLPTQRQAAPPPALRAAISQISADAAFRPQQMSEMPDSFVPRRPRGRPPTATTQASEIARLRAAGMRATDIAERLKICRASVYRVLNLTDPVPAPLETKTQPTQDADIARNRLLEPMATTP